MTLTFDLAPDELQVWLEDTDEHLRTLGEDLVRLETAGRDPALLDRIFRAAHTLKGLGGAIGHTRLAELTHAMEAALDAVRRGELAVTPVGVDTPVGVGTPGVGTPTYPADEMLAALDALGALREEVVTRREARVDVAGLVERIEVGVGFRAPTYPARTNARQAKRAARVAKDLSRNNSRDSGSRRAKRATPGSQGASEKPPEQSGGQPEGAPVHVVAVRFAPEAFGSAARALQALEALGGLGRVLSSEPPLEVIETAAPVSLLTARVAATASVSALQAALAGIPDVQSAVVRPEGGPEAEETPERKLLSPDRTVRASVERLDALLNLAGELVTDRNRLASIRAGLELRYRNDEAVGDLAAVVEHVTRVTDQLHAEVMRTRMLPISTVFSRFPRLVRDLARRSGKQVELVIRGAETELDRSVAELIGDPLVHLLRNALDHGLESPEARRAAGKAERGTVRLSARQERSYIVVAVEDDGRGVDRAKVREAAVRQGLLTRAAAEALSDEAALDLIFRPGLTTVPAVTDVSGRGVGMDVVRTNVERLGGAITVETWPGQGALFELHLPLTLAIVPSLLTRAGRIVCAIPIVAVTETLRTPVETIRSVGRREIITAHGRTLPLVRLGEAMGTDRRARPRKGFEYIVSVRSGKAHAGLVVEKLLGQQDLVAKSLGPLAGLSAGVSGAAILGDGQVALILDVPGVLKWAAT